MLNSSDRFSWHREPKGDVEHAYKSALLHAHVQDDVPVIHVKGGLYPAGMLSFDGVPIMESYFHVLVWYGGYIQGGQRYTGIQIHKHDGYENGIGRRRIVCDIEFEAPFATPEDAVNFVLSAHSDEIERAVRTDVVSAYDHKNRLVDQALNQYPKTLNRPDYEAACREMGFPPDEDARIYNMTSSYVTCDFGTYTAEQIAAQILRNKRQWHMRAEVRAVANYQSIRDATRANAQPGQTVYTDGKLHQVLSNDHELVTHELGTRFIHTWDFVGNPLGFGTIENPSLLINGGALASTPASQPPRACLYCGNGPIVGHTWFGASYCEGCS